MHPNTLVQQARWLQLNPCTQLRHIAPDVACFFLYEFAKHRKMNFYRITLQFTEFRTDYAVYVEAVSQRHAEIIALSHAVSRNEIMPCDYEIIAEEFLPSVADRIRRQGAYLQEQPNNQQGCIDHRYVPRVQTLYREAV